MPLPGDFVARLRKLLPASWFPQGNIAENPYPKLAGLLSGFANVAYQAYVNLVYAKAQTRMATTTDAFLDIASVDYCGARLPRNAGETDAAFRERITNEALRIRNTRQAIVTALMQTTGRVPQIFEPWNTGDCGALDYSIALAGGPFAGVGCCGDDTSPYQLFVNAYRPLSTSGFVASDAQIYAMVANCTAGGVIAWTNIQN